jgi:AcrR family transcriptional regulator
MPKIIDNLRDTIINTGREILLKEGYSSFSIRTLAEKSGIATGTIYNYFESKVQILANILIRDWNGMAADLEDQLGEAASVTEGIKDIHEAVSWFSSLYVGFFRDYSAGNSSNEIVRDYHRIVIDNVNAFLDVLFEKFGINEDRKIQTLLSEAIVSSAAYKIIRYDNIEALVKRLFER